MARVFFKLLCAYNEDPPEQASFFSEPISKLIGQEQWMKHAFSDPSKKDDHLKEWQAIVSESIRMRSHYAHARDEPGNACIMANCTVDFIQACLRAMEGKPEDQLKFLLEAGIEWEGRLFPQMMTPLIEGTTAYGDNEGKVKELMSSFAAILQKASREQLQAHKTALSHLCTPLVLMHFKADPNEAQSDHPLAKVLGALQKKGLLESVLHNRNHPSHPEKKG